MTKPSAAFHAMTQAFGRVAGFPAVLIWPCEASLQSTAARWADPELLSDSNSAQVFREAAAIPLESRRFSKPQALLVAGGRFHNGLNVDAQCWPVLHPQKLLRLALETLFACFRLNKPARLA